ncbi:glycosyltransferase family 4 protein [Treponema parvum]|uniref:Glycosyltransferase family 4 protein n=1 Tax=Treponema parvum TaxID=138851 RepID=A0A975F488_9SPIR|nr:glycosyltransferase family 1 protein [Treponema parvum]QTQ14420.1 glycosyltransferase family 4 protein [Treponema parvum]
MKIGIDTFGCEHGRSGLGSYLLSLTADLPEAADIEYELFGAPIDRYTYSSSKQIGYNSVSVMDNIVAQWLWHFFMANRFSVKRGYDAVLYTAAAHMIPLSFKVPGIAIVNDCLSAAKKNFLYRTQILEGLKNSAKIIASSQFISNDLKNLGIDASKIEVIYNGINHSNFYPHPLEDRDTVTIKPFAIKRPYLIYATRMSGPQKKHIELIRAFTLFKEKTHSPHRLVLTGGNDVFTSEIQKESAKSSAVSDIFLTGYFPPDGFPDLYSGADACIFPSVNEGVGLPVIEAMATGIPVACADSGALREVTGGNAVFFDPDNIEQFSSSIELIVSDRDCREKLIACGIDWTRRFQWSETAQKTVELIKKVL